MIQARNIDFTTLGGNFSTSEIDTGFTWIDGKKIYKKSFSFGGMASGKKTINHGISNLGTVINIFGSMSNGTTTYPLPSVMIGGLNYQVQAQVKATTIELDTGVDRTAYTSSFLTLYYTKATD